MNWKVEILNLRVSVVGGPLNPRLCLAMCLGGVYAAIVFLTFLYAQTPVNHARLVGRERSQLFRLLQ